MKFCKKHLLPLLAAGAMLLMPLASARAVQELKPAYLNNVGITQKLGAQVPLDLTFHDETGKSVKLSQYFDGKKKPVILTLVYYKCPQLCTLVLNDLNRGMNGLSTLSAGDDYQVVTVSFDPREGPEEAMDKKETYMQSYRRPHAAEGWHFLTGDEASIKKLADSVGFQYKFDPKFGQYIHPSGLIVLTPKGVVSRYFFGIDYDLKDLRLALEEASSNKVGSLTDRILLYCFQYDPTTNKYSLRIIRIMQFGGVLTMGALGAFWMAMHKRDNAANRFEASDGSLDDSEEKSGETGGDSGETGKQV
jgi:protein SCO1/2